MAPPTEPADTPDRALKDYAAENQFVTGIIARIRLSDGPPTVTPEPGDRLLLVTDGYLDRVATRLNIAGILACTLQRHPRQIVQELARNVLDVTGGAGHDRATRRR